MVLGAESMPMKKTAKYEWKAARNPLQSRFAKDLRPENPLPKLGEPFLANHNPSPLRN